MLEVLKRLLKGDFRLPSLFERESEEEYMARFYQRIADDMAEDLAACGSRFGTNHAGLFRARSDACH